MSAVCRSAPSSTSSANSAFLARTSSNVPWSWMTPWLMKTKWSQLRTVDRRWATTMTVTWPDSDEIVSVMVRSVRLSSADVASSSTSTSGSR